MERLTNNIQEINLDNISFLPAGTIFTTENGEVYLTVKTTGSPTTYKAVSYNTNSNYLNFFNKLKQRLELLQDNLTEELQQTLTSINVCMTTLNESIKQYDINASSCVVSTLPFGPQTVNLIFDIDGEEVTETYSLNGTMITPLSADIVHSSATHISAGIMFKSLDDNLIARLEMDDLSPMQTVILL